MKTKKIFTEEREKKVLEAIRRAERKTSGEIVPLVVDQSDPYPHLDFIGGLIGQFAGILVMLWVLPACDYLKIFSIQVLGFAVGFLVFRYTFFLKRIFLSPKVAEEEVFERALRAFHELELDRTRDRTGVLILVSILEHRVQVLADSGINSRVAPGTWDAVVNIILSGIRKGDLCQGVCDAIEHCGDILEKEFPIQPDDINELPDRLHKE